MREQYANIIKLELKHNKLLMNQLGLQAYSSISYYKSFTFFLVEVI